MRNNDLRISHQHKKVGEYGLVRHPKIKFLGASPDGIVGEYKLRTKSGRTWEEIKKEVEVLIKTKVKYDIDKGKRMSNAAITEEMKKKEIEKTEIRDKIYKSEGFATKE